MPTKKLYKMAIRSAPYGTSLSHPPCYCFLWVSVPSNEYFSNNPVCYSSLLATTLPKSSAIVTLASMLFIHAAPAPAVPQPPPVPLVANASAIASGLKMQPSVNDCFKMLLTDSSGNLLTGDALRQLTVFDFNNQKPNAGAKGGSILLATVDNFPRVSRVAGPNGLRRLAEFELAGNGRAGVACGVAWLVLDYTKLLHYTPPLSSP
ncbi:hypothetical protein DFH08DRAFT_816090 [Mycena albidolilacea]|uniref:Uncharacterized protein n=1 Tax=Mycena albidolilacea TaxID=1033008 RepID=A0AAD7EIY6_9AGAR|nr:hypothetical protein DFH08DRAFT_816090 [Mycena albidolilacea]